MHSYEIWHSAAHMTIAPITAYFYQGRYISQQFSDILPLGRYISHRFLLVLNQIQISSTGKITFIWMNALVGAVACELILPGSVSLLVVKLLRNICLNFSVSKLFYREITEQCWQSIFALNYSVHVICAWCIVRATVCSLCVCVTGQQGIRLERD